MNDVKYIFTVEIMVSDGGKDANPMLYFTELSEVFHFMTVWFNATNELHEFKITAEVR